VSNRIGWTFKVKDARWVGEAWWGISQLGKRGGVNTKSEDRENYSENWVLRILRSVNMRDKNNSIMGVIVTNNASIFTGM
jgi:hypothetical protein